MTETKQPEKKIVYGTVSATVWKEQIEKDGKTFDVRNVSVSRSYKDKEDKWQNTNSMRVEDLPKVCIVCQKAYEFITKYTPKEKE